jgi:hypothetical protein
LRPYGWIEEKVQTDDKISRSRAKSVMLIVAAWSLAMIWFAVASGPQHEYLLYLSQWSLVLSGADPWSTSNAYGPLHNLLAYLLPLGQLGPKVLIVSALIAANAALVYEIVRSGGTAGDYGIYLLTVPTNFLVIIMAFAYGLNDALVAAFVVFAILARFRDKMIVSGCLLGVAILLKYYPIFLVPLFALEHGRFRFRLVAAAGMVTVIGLAAAAVVWGGAFIAPMTFGVERPPRLLSVLWTLNSYPSAVGGIGVVRFLARVNAVCVAAVGAMGIAIAWKLRLHWLEASVLGLLAVLLTYKVGNPQFFVPWLFLVAALLLAKTISARRLALLCLPFVLFLSAFEWGYAYGSDGYHERLGIVRQNVGLLAFAFGLTTVAAYFWMLRRLPSGSLRAPPAQPANPSA